MKIRALLPSALFCLAVASGGMLQAQTYDGSPYTDWASDYSGSEPHTLLLWKFDQPSPRSNSAASAYAVASSGPRTAPGVDGGKFGEALLIPERASGETDFVQASGSISSLFSASAMSVEFWFRPLEDGIVSGNLAYFFDKQYNTRYGLQLRLDSSVAGNPGALSFIVGNGVDANLGVRTGGLDWKADQWYHIAVTFEEINNDATIKIFRDGVMLDSATREGFGPMVNSGSLWRVGNRLGSSYGSLPGYFDNFRISDVAYQYAAIPEPSVAAIVAIGGLGLLLAARRRRSKPL